MTPNFTLEEFTRSSAAAARGIDNTMPPGLVPEALKTLEMMERIRAELSRLAGRDIPIFPSSGYRSPALNWAVRRPKAGPGVDPTGDHPRAKAMDWRAPEFGTPYEICRALAPLVSTLGIGQLIYEGDWVHTSTQAPDKALNRIITKLAKGYAVGIVRA